MAGVMQLSIIKLLVPPIARTAITGRGGTIQVNVQNVIVQMPGNLRIFHMIFP
jgi:hypothetical protein